MISRKQTIHLMADCWNPACQAQGWKRSDRAFRLQKFGEILGRELCSSDDLEPLGEFDLLKRELLALADKVVMGDPQQKKLLWLVRHQLRPCLALYVLNPDAYIAGILKERHKVFGGLSTVESLSAQARPGKKHSDLMMFIFTLNDRIDAMRSAAGDTGHTMCGRARVKCKCAECQKNGQWHRAEMEQVVEDDNQPF